MTDVVDRLAAAMNAHDLDAVAGLIHPGYRSEQPTHPGRAFTGRAQMLANWEAMLSGIPDFRAEICRSVHDGDTTWTEWHWSGTDRGNSLTTTERASPPLRTVIGPRGDGLACTQN
jgi:SnoaL-like protein